MRSYYVNVDGVPLEFLEFMGFIVVGEDEDFWLLNNKGTEHILPKEGERFLMVDDSNDADALRSRPRLPLPPRD